LGRSRGGLTTKIHVAADSNCRVLARVTSAGQRHDSLAFEPVMARISIARRGPRGTRPRTRPGRVLADKAYSSKAIRGHLRRRHIKATIPEPADQIKNRLTRGRRGGRPPAFDREQYKRRNAVERAFAKLRQHRAVATRFDKRDFVYRGTVDVASIRIWLRDPVK
jgi:transposase